LKEKDILKESAKSNNVSHIIRSFGRIKSRKLSDNKKLLINNALQKYQIKNIDASNDYNNLEIGFGFGDFLYNYAVNNPSIINYGCEPHINGVANLLSMLDKNPLKNLFITTQDVRILLDNFSDNFFNTIHILFPDPWPKVKHYKRRLINLDFLDNMLAKKLKKHGKIIIATDHDSYKTWIMHNILKSTKFIWICESKTSWENFPNAWHQTKYQKKALNEGRKPVIIEITKIHD